MLWSSEPSTSDFCGTTSSSSSLPGGQGGGREGGGPNAGECSALSLIRGSSNCNNLVWFLLLFALQSLEKNIQTPLFKINRYSVAVTNLQLEVLSHVVEY